MTEVSTESATLVLYDFSAHALMKKSKCNSITDYLDDNWMEGVKIQTEQLDNSMTKMFQFLKMDKKMHPLNMKNVERAQDKFVTVCSGWKEVLWQPSMSKNPLLAVCSYESESKTSLDEMDVLVQTTTCKIQSEISQSMLEPYADNQPDSGCNTLVSASSNWRVKLEKETQQMENRVLKMFKFLKADKKMHPKNMEKIEQNENKFITVCNIWKGVFLFQAQQNAHMQLSTSPSTNKEICTYDAGFPTADDMTRNYIIQIHHDRDHYRNESIKMDKKCYLLLSKIQSLTQQLQDTQRNRFFKRGLRSPSTAVSTRCDSSNSCDDFSKDYALVKLKMEYEGRLLAAESVQKSLEEQIVLLKSQVDVLSSENDQLQALCITQDKNELSLIKILESQNSPDNSKKARLRKLEDELDKKQEILIAKEAELFAKERKLRKLELDTKRFRKHSMICDTVEENSKLKDEIANLKMEITSKLSKQEKLMAATIEHNSELKLQVESLENQLMKTLNSMALKKAKRANKTAENKDLKEKVKCLEREIADGVLLSKDYADLVEKSDEYKELLDKSELSNAKLKKELEAVKLRGEDFKKLKQSVKNLEDQFTDLKSESVHLWEVVTTKLDGYEYENEDYSEDLNSSVATEASENEVEDFTSPTEPPIRKLNWSYLFLITVMYIIFMYYVYILVCTDSW